MMSRVVEQRGNVHAASDHGILRTRHLAVRLGLGVLSTVGDYITSRSGRELLKIELNCGWRNG